MDEAELLRYAQLGAQVLAVINADWHRPTLEQIEYILDQARSQARDAVAIAEIKATGSRQTPAQP